MSLVASCNFLKEEIRFEQAVNCPSSAQREFAIAITEIENASMRIARGLLLKQGLVATPEEVAAATLDIEIDPDQLSLLDDATELAESG